MNNTPLIIGTRGSELALWQANTIKSRLEKLGVTAELFIIKTQGDQIQHLSFDKMEGKGFFTKEIEEALLNKTIDLAVHSHKDLETTNPTGLVIAAVSEREDPSELLLIQKDKYNPSNPWGLASDAIVGTSSARRKAQLINRISTLNIKDLRGNVPTRIQKLRDKNYDAIMLAKAGVSRLNIDLSEFVALTINPLDFIPAPAQGVMAIQIREADTHIADILKPLNNEAIQNEIAVERGVLRKMQGGCQIPLGVYCTKKGQTYQAHSFLASSDLSNPQTLISEGNSIEDLVNQIYTGLISKKKQS